VTSTVLAGLVRGFGMLAWMLVLLPALYAGADLAEDGLLAVAPAVTLALAASGCARR